MPRKQPHRTLGECAQFVVDELQRRGIQVLPGSRFAKYLAGFEKNAYAAPWGPADQDRALESLMAQQDVQEACLIVDAFPATEDVRLDAIVQDSVNQKLDRSTPGRDLQFELFIGATCRMGGMETKPDREPDLWCNVGGAWVAAAAKRVRSGAQFVKRLKEAAGQIQESEPIYGIVFIETSRAWDPELAIIATKQPEAVMAHDLRERLYRFLDSHNREMDNTWQRYPKALGLVCLDRTFVHHEESGHLIYQNSVFSQSLIRDRNRNRLWSAFQSGWGRGSPQFKNMDLYPRAGRFIGSSDNKIIPMQPRD